MGKKLRHSGGAVNIKTIAWDGKRMWVGSGEEGGR